MTESFALSTAKGYDPYETKPSPPKYKGKYKGREITINTFWHPMGNHVVLSIDGKMLYFTKGDMRNKQTLIKDAKREINGSSN